MPDNAISRFLRRWRGSGGGKRFAGSIFDRFAGLDPLFDRSDGLSILDVGSCDGLVAYEFARRGAKLVHGLERDPQDVRFARRLFRDVPAESAFIETDLRVSGRELGRRHGRALRERYDLVLFLGVYQHLSGQMEPADLVDLVDFLLKRAGRIFAVRTAQLDEIEPQVIEAGFERTSEHPAREDVGPLRIYERRGAR